MKKTIGITVIAVILIAAIYFFGTGFLKNGSVYINDFSVSADGKVLTLEIGVASSAGAIRKIEALREGGKLYLDCYAAFGGINGALGAKTTYQITLNDETESVALYRNTNCYEVLLEKGSDGIWKKV